jgi:hypothetical protein
MYNDDFLPENQSVTPWYDRYVLNLLGDRRLSDFGRPSPQYALNSGFGRQGIVLDPNYRGEENLYREPPQEDLNKGLEKFHEGTPAENGPIQNIGDIDEFWRRQAARFFTG